MTILADALLIVDLQNGVCFENGKIYHYDQVIALVNRRIEAYYHANKPIIFVRHIDDELVCNSPAWEIVADLAVDKASFFIDKYYSSAFYQTDLNQKLQQLQVKSLEICGAQTPLCVDATVKTAHFLGYRLYMKKGATTTHFAFYMTAEETIKHYENVWGTNQRFLTLLD